MCASRFGEFIYFPPFPTHTTKSNRSDNNTGYCTLCLQAEWGVLADEQVLVGKAVSVTAIIKSLDKFSKSSNSKKRAKVCDKVTAFPAPLNHYCTSTIRVRWVLFFFPFVILPLWLLPNDSVLHDDGACVYTYIHIHDNRMVLVTLVMVVFMMLIVLD